MNFKESFHFYEKTVVTSSWSSFLIKFSNIKNWQWISNLYKQNRLATELLIKKEALWRHTGQNPYFQHRYDYPKQQFIKMKEECNFWPSTFTFYPLFMKTTLEKSFETEMSYKTTYLFSVKICFSRNWNSACFYKLPNFENIIQKN